MEPEIPEEDFDAEDYSYGDEMYDTLSKCVKQFLIDYYGESFYNLEPKTYLKLENIIREELTFYGESIPDILYRYRTITDSDLWDEALDNFKRTDMKFPWPKRTLWYDKISANEDDDNEFLNNIAEAELTEEQKKAKQIYEALQDIIDYQTGFSNFMKQGCGILIPATQSFIEKTAPFDLSILSLAGFDSLQSFIEMIADSIFDRLYGLLDEQKTL